MATKLPLKLREIQLNQLADLINQAELEETLSGEPSFTIFAPTDEVRPHLVAQKRGLEFESQGCHFKHSPSSCEERDVSGCRMGLGCAQDLLNKYKAGIKILFLFRPLRDF